MEEVESESGGQVSVTAKIALDKVKQARKNLFKLIAIGN